MNEPVGERIAQVRKAMKMTRTDLATGMSVRLGRAVGSLTISEIESGKRFAPVDELLAAASTLRVRPTDLLSAKHLPNSSIDLASAAQELSQAIDAVREATRGWRLARKRLRNMIADDRRVLGSLPSNARRWVKLLHAQRLEDIVAGAQAESRVDERTESISLSRRNQFSRSVVNNRRAAATRL